MDRRQLVDVYDHVTANWNLEPAADRAKTLDIWWRYLNDCPYDNVIATVDRRALAGDYPPRPAELRVETLAGDNMPPTPAEALAQAQQLTEAIKTGTQIPQVHELVSTTMQAYGMQRDNVFMDIYKERRRGWLATRYPCDTDGGNMNPE